MSLERLELGAEPLVKVRKCAGNLDVRGSERMDVRIDSGSPQEARYTTEGNALIVEELREDARIYVPEGGRIEVEHVDGNLDIKDVRGSVSIGQAHGDLSARRCHTLAVGEVKGSVQIKEIEGHVQIGEISGSCTIRQAGSLIIEGGVYGSLYAREVGGEVQVGDVYGSLTAREIGSLAASRVEGEISVRSCGGNVAVQATASDALLRDIGGQVTIERVSGDLIVRNVLMGLQIDHVHGDAVLRTAFDPDATWLIRRIEGEAVARLAGSGDVSFVLSPSAKVHGLAGQSIRHEAERTLALVGNGAATVYLEAEGGLIIKGGESMDDEFTVGFDEDFDQRWENITTRIEEQLEHKLAGLPERIRHRVEHKLNAARRHVESAQRRAEEVVRRAERQLEGFDINIGSGGLARAEPVSEEERLTILQMLEEGKITVEQAEQLLSALEG